MFDEGQNGDPDNDDKGWHSHWVMLTEGKTCGGVLKVRDVSSGVDLSPTTAPMLPIALNSPGISPLLDGITATITVPVGKTEKISCHVVTAEP